jgi:hypothetical protein
LQQQADSIRGKLIAWTFDEAQEDLDELIDLALAGLPQRVQFGDKAVIVLPEETYELLSRRKPALKELLLNGPDLSDIDLSRNQTAGREFDWE